MKEKLPFGDTDFLCYFIKTLYLEKDKLEEIGKYEASNYPQNHYK